MPDSDITIPEPEVGSSLWRALVQERIRNVLMEHHVPYGSATRVAKDTVRRALAELALESK